MYLLALAVPAQGFSGASMVRCGSGQHRAGDMRSHAMAMHGNATEVAQRSHHHHHDRASTAEDNGHHKAHVGEKSAKASSCSACASSCTSAGLPTALMIFKGADLRDAFDSPTPQPVASFISAGPDRPPRNLVA